MHVFLMFSSFQMPLQMRLTTQLVIIFTLCLLCLLLCAVFSALSSAACTTAQYQASMQKWPNKLCKNHWAENSSEAYPGKSGNWRPKQNAISKLPRVRLRFTFEPGITLFPQLFPGLGHGLSLSHEWLERGQSPNVDIAPGHPLHLSPTAMGIWHPKSSVLCKSLHRRWLFCLNVCFRLSASPASAIMTLVLLSTGNVGCFQGSGWNEGKGLFISLQRVRGTTSAQVVKFPLSTLRDASSSTHILACSWELWLTRQEEKIKRMLSMCSFTATNMVVKGSDC